MDYVDRIRNATIDECAAHLVAVHMDHAEAYRLELLTMKKYEHVEGPTAFYTVPVAVAEKWKEQAKKLLADAEKNLFGGE